MTNPVLIPSHLAQSGSGEAVWDVVIWVIVLIVVVMLFGVVLMKLRRVMQESEQMQTKGLLLDDLRRLRDEGLLTTEEYQRAVEAMAGRLGGSPGARSSGE